MNYLMNFYSTFKKAYTYVGHATELESVDEIASLIEELTIQATHKEATSLYNFCTYNEGEDRERAPMPTDFVIPDIDNTIRRCKNNCIGLTAIVLDFDNNVTIAQGIALVSEFEFIIYTTFNHSEEQHKFRIILPLARLLPTEELTIKKDALIARFPGVDKTSFSVTQAFYLPSYSEANADIRLFYHNKDGVLFNPDIIPFPPPAPVAPPRPAYTGVQGGYLPKLLGCLMTGSGMHYSEVMSVASLIKSAGGTIDDLTTVIQQIRSPQSKSLIDPAEMEKIRNKSWTQASGKFGVEARTRLLKQLNCEPYPIPTFGSGQRQDTSEDLARKLRAKYNF